MDSNELCTAYEIYRTLYTEGECGGQAYKQYNDNTNIQSIIEVFLQEDETAIITSSEKLYLVAKSSRSHLNLSNPYIKKFYFKADTKNIELYMIYFSMIVIIGKD